MVNLPTVKQLRYLVALEKHLHFGNAADACFVTQSAFSVAIKDLENILNVSLVDRTNRSVVFTNVGKLVAQQARLAIFDVEGIIDIANSAQDPLCGTLKMGVIPTIAPFLLPKILPAIRKKYPKLDLYLYEEQTKKIHQLLLEGELDILLLALPYDLKNTETISIFNDPFKLAYKKETSLIDPNKFSGLSRKGNISKFSANGLYSLIQMVNSDLGITFIPQMAIDCGLLKNTKVQTKALKEKSYREIGLAWRKSSVRIHDFKLLADVILSVAQK